MRLPGSLRLFPLVTVAAAAGAAAFFVLHASPVRAECGTASSAPCPPTPTPVNAFLSLDVTQGGPTTVINVTGGQFLPNEAMSLYWDRTDHVAGSATADANGSFNTRVKPFAGDANGVHHLCASVVPNPCANFTLVAPDASPSPTASPTDQTSPSASPDESPAFVATPARVSTTLSGFDVITRPPFVFLPIFGLGAILLSLAYWAAMSIRKPRRAGLLPSAAVVHRATRPDYAAGFGTAPSAPTPAPQPSAWSEPIATPRPAPAAAQPVEPPAPQLAPEEQVEWGPPVEWGTGVSDWGFAEPPSTDEPEVPQPGD